jgi:putative YphP/YqiW family bacilliredoxin
MHDAQQTAPLRQELVDAGVTELLTPEAVDKALSGKETSLVFVNSVCGCTARIARPALVEALKHQPRPLKAYTVFAGADKEATARVREYFVGYPPSSPSLGLFRDGQLVHLFERHEIEGIDAASFALMVESAFDRYCGPKIDESIPIHDPMAGIEIDPTELAALLKSGKKPVIIDCREDGEREKADLPGSRFLTQELAEEITEKWNHDEPFVIFCHYGERSLQAVRFFKQFGFTKAQSLRGGIDAWARAVDTGVPLYT